MSNTKKTPAKKAAPKKAAKKTAPAKENVFNWTDEQKDAAHAKLLKEYNRVEPEKRKTLQIEFMPDGTAKTRGKAKATHSIKM